MKKLLLFVVLVLGACTTISSQRERKVGNTIQTYEESFNRIFGRRKVKEGSNIESGIKSFQTDYEALLINNEIKIEITRNSVSVETIHGSRFINRNDYGTYTVASGLHYCPSAPVMRVVVENNDLETVVRFYIGKERCIDHYHIKQYREKPLNKRYGGVNHRSTYRPRIYH